jgi:hypothetical protein
LENLEIPIIIRTNNWLHQLQFFVCALCDRKRFGGPNTDKTLRQKSKILSWISVDQLSPEPTIYHLKTLNATKVNIIVCMDDKRAMKRTKRVVREMLMQPIPFKEVGTVSGCPALEKKLPSPPLPSPHLGKPIHTLFPCWMPKPLSSKN